MLEKLLLKLTDAMKSGTPSERKIAKYIMEHLAELPFETAATLAVKLNLSPMTVGRFMRSLGYRQLSDIRESLREPPGVPFAGHVTEAGKPEQPDSPLASLLMQQIQAIQGVYDLARQPAWLAAINAISGSADVFIASSADILTISLYLQSRMLECRSNVHHIQLGGATYMAFFDHPAETTLLLLMDCEGSPLPLQRLARTARKMGYMVLLVTSRYYEWGPDSADICLTIPLPQNGGQSCVLQQISVIEFMLHSISSLHSENSEKRSNRLAELHRSLRA